MLWQWYCNYVLAIPYDSRNVTWQWHDKHRAYLGMHSTYYILKRGWESWGFPLIALSATMNFPPFSHLCFSASRPPSMLSGCCSFACHLDVVAIQKLVLLQSSCWCRLLQSSCCCWGCFRFHPYLFLSSFQSLGLRFRHHPDLLLSSFQSLGCFTWPISAASEYVLRVWVTPDTTQICSWVSSRDWVVFFFLFSVKGFLFFLIWFGAQADYFGFFKLFV